MALVCQRGVSHGAKIFAPWIEVCEILLLEFRTLIRIVRNFRTLIRTVRNFLLARRSFLAMIITNVLKTGPVIEPEKLPVHGSLVGPRSNRY